MKGDLIMEFNIHNLKALVEGKESGQTFSQKAGQATGKAARTTSDAVGKGASYLSGLAPTTRRRFEDEQEETMKRDLTLNEKIDFLYEVFEIDQLSAEELQTAVEDKYKAILEAKAAQKEAEKEARRQARRDKVASAKEKFSAFSTDKGWPSGMQEKVEESAKKEAAQEKNEQKEVKKLNPAPEKEAKEERVNEEPKEEKPSKPTRRMRINFDK